MRVISGRLGGRNFNSPHGHRTHPMSEKIRGAIFNALGDLSGLTALDAFAGTGALAIEAVSRGVVHAVAVDLDGLAHRTIKENVQTLGLDEQIEVIRAGVQSWSRRHPRELFDILFLDPPFDNVEPKLLIALARQHTKQGSIVVISLPLDKPLLLSDTQYELFSMKTYGDASVSIYRKI